MIERYNTCCSSTKLFYSFLQRLTGSLGVKMPGQGIWHHFYGYFLSRSSLKKDANESNHLNFSFLDRMKDKKDLEDVARGEETASILTASLQISFHRSLKRSWKNILCFFAGCMTPAQMWIFVPFVLLWSAFLFLQIWLLPRKLSGVSTVILGLYELTILFMTKPYVRQVISPLPQHYRTL